MAAAELGGAAVELGGDFAGGGRCAGGGPLGPRALTAGLGEVEALEASVEDAGDGAGAVEGALVIWVTRVRRSWPARLAARSAAWRAWREYN
jgi:hypothetical protein